MFSVVLSRQAKKTLLSLKGARQGEKLHGAIQSIISSPQKGANIKALAGVTNGFRKRIGRYRMLYTIDTQEELIRIWIIDMEKDTKKDYKKWVEYIVQNL